MATNQPFIELQRVKRYFSAYLGRAVNASSLQDRTSQAGKHYKIIDILDPKTNDSYILRWIYCNQRGAHTYLLKASILEQAEKQLKLDQKWAYSYYPDRQPVLDCARAIKLDDGTSEINAPTKTSTTDTKTPEQKQ